MTAPVSPGSLGTAFVNLRVETKQVPGDVRKGLKDAGRGADDILDKVGESWGDHLADSTSDELRRHGKDFGDAISDAVGRHTIHLNGRRFVLDRRGNLHDSAGRFAGRFISEVENAFDRVIGGGAGGGGGPLGRIGQAMADAIGAGFNISGRSPLIAFLIPAVGAIVGLILGAIQGAQSLVAILTTLPTVIAGIGLQIGTLAIAFNGVGDAVKNAFAAKNAKELQEAVKGLTPEAQRFVKSLLPLKPVFEQIQKVTQSNFFRALGDPVSRLKFLSPTFIQGFGLLATTLGRFFRDLGIFFASPTFVNFVRDVFPATARWIQRFGPAFISILGSLIGMADHSIPFLEKIGLFISQNLKSLSRFFDEAIRSGAFKQWLDNMLRTFQLLMEVFGQAIKFVGIFVSVLDQAGGDKILSAIADAVERIGAFLASPVGLKAMEGLVNLVILSIQVFAGLVIVIFTVLAALQLLGEALAELFTWITTVAWPGIRNFFHDAKDFFAGIAPFFMDVFRELGVFINGWIQQQLDRFRSWVHNATEEIRGLPDRVRRALGNLGHVLWDAGRALIGGFIGGIRAGFSDLGSAAREAVHIVTDWLPGSPAKVGPLSGEGYALYRGERMVEDLGRGMRAGFGQLQTGIASDLGAMVGMISPSTNTSSGVVFGPGAVRVTFEGAVPTEEEAHRTGRAVGAGIADQLAKRSTVLAVRTL